MPLTASVCRFKMFLLNPCCSKVKSLLKATASLTLWQLLFLYKKRNTNEYIVYTFLIF